MDELDARIVEALQTRGDMTHAELADRVGSTASTCLRRIRDLRKSGVLTHNIFLAEAAKLGRGLSAVITVSTKDHTRSDREKFATGIQEEPSIAYAYGVTGELDAILIGNFRDMVEYQQVCDRLFDGVESIVRYTTHFIAESYKSVPAIPCDAVSQGMRSP
ncbi:Lrp/AsnC family transcriptional regulator [Cognatishimia sp. 1_MG-2023]|uniref:Lrp/AsnC family transcriptional regulator n=1 Tax=Cognatishimia sp. 1_MG-2023 TaxID=3062642 RepID=UPI0026E1DD34|nr:Lrp/AsnC family transcriptional regulator [Cognatishimia sp. 1_MG-2023]MDO6727712.1 Lrp/AsnC family transcriptional regulator [Cognatishimia sp. 1_MG-2023]